MATIVAGGEEDSSVGLGWHGHWVTALLENRDCRQPVGERTEIVWNYHTINWDSEPIETWGAELRLEVSLRTFTVTRKVLTAFARL